MNILFLAPSFPSEFHRIRSLYLLQYLNRFHKISLVSLSDQKTVPLKELKPYCHDIQVVYQPKIRSWLSCLFFLFSSLPLEVAYCRNSKFHEVVSEILKNHSIDLIYIKRLRSAQFVPLETKTPCVLDTTDAMSLFYQESAKAVPWIQKPLFFEEAFKYEHYEKKLMRRFKHWIVCSSVDLDYLKRENPQNHFYLIPNGVHIPDFAPSNQPPEKNALIFSGLMDKFVNIEAAQFFCRSVLPIIQKKIPDVRLYVAGPNPAQTVRSLASKNVTVTGEVPDLRTYIERSEVVVCPLLTGTGTKNKILQAWSIGRPVVSTSKGLEGLEAQNQIHALKADRPEEFAHAVVQLLKDTGLQNRLIQNGFQIIREKYSTEVIGQALNTLLERIAHDQA